MIFENKTIKFFGIGNRINPKEIENLFSKTTNSQNPYIAGLNAFFGETSYPMNEMPFIVNTIIPKIDLSKGK